MKALLKVALSRLPLIGELVTVRRYQRFEWSLLFLNFVVQRLVRYQAKLPWMIHFTSRVVAPRNIVLEAGPASYLTYGSFLTSSGCYYQALNKIHFGNGALWAPGVKFVSSNHGFTATDEIQPAEPIFIGKHTWIGANATILPGVRLGDYSIVGAGSVLTRSVESYVIVAGVPARIIAKRCRTCLDKIPVGPSDTCISCAAQGKAQS